MVNLEGFNINNLKSKLFYDMFFISSTTCGFAKVVMSPTSCLFAIADKTLRIILPDLVFGISGTIHTLPGFAMGPISLANLSVTFFSISALAFIPGLRETNMCGIFPFIGSTTGTTAASPISSTINRSRFKFFSSQSMSCNVYHIIYPSEDTEITIRRFNSAIACKVGPIFPILAFRIFIISRIIIF